MAAGYWEEQRKEKERRRLVSRALDPSQEVTLSELLEAATILNDKRLESDPRFILVSWILEKYHRISMKVRRK